MQVNPAMGPLLMGLSLTAILLRWVNSAIVAPLLMGLSLTAILLRWVNSWWHPAYESVTHSHPAQVGQLMVAPCLMLMSL